MATEQVMNLLKNPQVMQVVQSVLGRLTKGNGGGANFSSLLDNLNQGGLKDQVSSWLGQGPNQPVTGQQLTQALGEEAIGEAAAQAGTTPQQAADELAQVLPQLVNEASPDGKAPSPQQAQNLLSQLLPR